MILIFYCALVIVTVSTVDIKQMGVVAYVKLVLRNGGVRFTSILFPIFRFSSGILPSVPLISCSLIS